MPLRLTRGACKTQHTLLRTCVCLGHYRAQLSQRLVRGWIESSRMSMPYALLWKFPEQTGPRPCCQTSSHGAHGMCATQRLPVASAAGGAPSMSGWVLKAMLHVQYLGRKCAAGMRLCGAGCSADLVGFLGGRLLRGTGVQGLPLIQCHLLHHSPPVSRTNDVLLEKGDKGLR